MSVEPLQTEALNVLDSRPTTLRQIVSAGLAMLVPEHAGESAEKEYLLSFNRPNPFELETALQNCLQNPAEEERAICKLFSQYQLNIAEMIALSLCLQVEKQAMAGRALAWLQYPAGGSRPTLGLMEKLLSVFGMEGDWLISELLAGKALAAQILQIGKTDQPVPEQVISIPMAVLMATSGKHSLRSLPACSLLEHTNVSLSEGTLDECIAHAHSLNQGKRTALVIRSGSVVESESAARVITRTMGRQAMLCKNPKALPAGCGVLFSVCRAIPVLRVDTFEQDFELPALPGYTDSIIVLCGSATRAHSEGYSLLDWQIPVPDKNERRKIWQHFFADGESAAVLAEKYIHSAARIHQLASVAARYAAKDCRKPQLQDVIFATREGQGDYLGSLVQRITDNVDDEGLVLDNGLRKQLLALHQRCCKREQLSEQLGVSIRQRYHRGVKALMVGPSGTGKTLSASWLAHRMGLPLYRVDTASVVSKYIGETEKNLADLLDKAESADVVLLFDEADSLFGKRTEVKDSSDRFANSQSNYLLQRLENYRGIVLLTSNSRTRIDQAFLRRLDHIIEFTQPGAEERRKLWRVHLGEKHSLSQKEINKLAVKCELGGGHIRNAVLSGAVSALSHERSISFCDIIDGVESEYRKLGKQLPMGLKA